MTDTEGAKSMARQLRAALTLEGVTVSHSKALELVAKTLGHSDWNIAAAALDRPAPATDGIRFKTCSPILRIFDERKAEEFYCDFLGFEIAFSHRFGPNMPLYLGVTRAGLSLHLSEHHGDASPGSTVFVTTTGIRRFHTELAAKRYAYGRPGLHEQPWGLQMEVHDPFGNRIRFCEQEA